ncbi:hypothetical protein SUGI_0196000 [Cryptomeria japonica]|nr:hypothetical protein SUGI_0196000 [Cryptomeria japonica]
MRLQASFGKWGSHQIHVELIENGFKWSNQTFRWSLQKNFGNIYTAIFLDLVGMDGSGKITLAKQLDMREISCITK